MNKIPDSAFPVFEITEAEAEFLRGYPNQAEYFLCVYCNDYNQYELVIKIDNVIGDYCTLAIYLRRYKNISNIGDYDAKQLRMQWLKVLFAHNGMEF